MIHTHNTDKIMQTEKQIQQVLNKEIEKFIIRQTNRIYIITKMNKEPKLILEKYTKHQKQYKKTKREITNTQTIQLINQNKLK